MRRSLILYVVSMVAMWGLVIPSLAAYLDHEVNRPLCADSPNATLKGRVAATYVTGDRFYVYLSKDTPPQISTEPLPLNLSEWRMIELTQGGIVDICITEN